MDNGKLLVLGTPGSTRMTAAEQGTRSWRFWLLAILGGLLLMFAVMVVVELASGDWLAVEAEVTATDIVSYSSGGGPLAWELDARFEYEAEGHRFVSPSLRVFLDQDYSVVAAERESWPVGRTSTIYYKAGSPGAVSTAADGGAQGSAVVMALFVPVLYSLALIAWESSRRTRRLRRAAM
jgi:hypothetical protein